MESTSQPNVGGGLPQAGPDLFSITSTARAPSEEMRASFAAVRAAREAARMRDRRDTMRVRALTATALVTFLAGILILGHLRGLRDATAGTGGPASTLAARIPMPALGAEVGPPAPGALSSGGASLAAEPAINAESASTSNAARDALADCTDAIQRRRLRTAAGACAAAFAAQPSDASLAMKVAHVQHARGQYVDAGEWARRAIALEARDPDAYLILAHAEKRARHPAAANDAYGRYLELAPRGWHAAEAREVLRAAKRQAP
jgi:tetratricopeptide (TPR) repeat protein